MLASLPSEISRRCITDYATYLGSCPAMICWNIPTHAPRLPSQYSGLGSSLSKTSNAFAA